MEVVYSLIQYMSYTFRMTGSRLPIAVGSSSSLPLSFGTPRQLGKGRLQGSPFENITTAFSQDTVSQQGSEGSFVFVFGLIGLTDLSFVFFFSNFSSYGQAVHETMITKQGYEIELGGCASLERLLGLGPNLEPIELQWKR